MRLAPHGVLIATLLTLAACARQAPPANTSQYARPAGDEGARQTQRADVDKAIQATETSWPR